MAVIATNANKLCQDLISQRYAEGLKTYIITLKFPDFTLLDRELLDQISYGGDLWEFRADLLECPSSEQTGIPPLEHVRSQLQTLRSLTTLPVLFTVRTVSQGGKFPNNASQEALALMKLAVEVGCEYIDVELDWPSFVFQDIRACKGSSKIIASYHEFSGNIRWTSTALQEKCTAADAIGDITKLCIQAVDINDSLELALYVRDYQLRAEKPVIAVAMGRHGQLSRFTAAVTFVTHKLIPQPPGSDQLTLSDINRALCLLGQLPKRKFCIVGAEYFHHRLSAFLHPAFEELGLPYSLFEAGQTLEAAVARPDFGGAYFAAPGLASCEDVQSLSPAARKIGTVDTISVIDTPDGRFLYGDNTTWAAIKACIGKNVTGDIGTSTAFIIGDDYRARAACYAVRSLGFTDVIIDSGDEEKSQAIVSDFQGHPVSFRIGKLADIRVSEVGKLQRVVIIQCAEHHVLSQDLLDITSRGSTSTFIEMERTSHSEDFTQDALLRDSWDLFTADDVFREQAYVLFETWSRRRAPKFIENMNSAM